MLARTESPPEYATKESAEDEIIRRALEILARRVAAGPTITGPEPAYSYFRVWLGGRDTEAMAVMYLNTAHQVITCEIVAEGTINEAKVYSREVLTRVLHHKAAAVLLSHNHPSGTMTFSEADIRLTQKLKAALQLIDVIIIDHILVSPTGSLSMREERVFPD